MNNTTFPFYTSTAAQDANRVNTPFVRICPRDRLLPFQIERSHNTSAVQTIKLVDCSGNETSLGTGYFSSIGTSLNDDSSVGVKEFTSVDYIQYNGGALKQSLPYGVYYLEVADNYGAYYSEHFSVRRLSTDLVSVWDDSDFTTLVTDGLAVLTGYTATGADPTFLESDSFSAKIGETVTFICNTTSVDSDPDVLIRDTVGNKISNDVNIALGMNEIELTLTHTADAVLRIETNTDGNFVMPYATLKRDGDYIKIEFSNTNDLIHSGTGDIMYATGGFKQRVYLDTRLNLPRHEPVEVGEELDGVFIAEQMNSTYLYSVVDYVSRSMYNGLQYLPLHDTIEITDEVGNTYTPDVGNIDVTMDWGTFDTGSARIEFNDGSMTWISDQDNIT